MKKLSVAAFPLTNGSCKVRFTLLFNDQIRRPVFHTAGHITVAMGPKYTHDREAISELAAIQYLLDALPIQGLATSRLTNKHKRILPKGRAATV